MYPIARLTNCLHTYLQKQTSAVGEYQLIKVLEGEGAFECVEQFSSSLRLFHKHFITMHCLYKLQQQVYPQRLEVSPLAIRLHPAQCAPVSGSAVSPDTGRLAAYYLDLGHLTSATEDSVAELLTQFWQSLDAIHGADDAFAVLQLSPSASWPQVKAAYRHQVQQAHPDKGGSSASFARIREAYQVLRRYFQQD